MASEHLTPLILDLWVCFYVLVGFQILQCYFEAFFSLPTSCRLWSLGHHPFKHGCPGPGFHSLPQFSGSFSPSYRPSLAGSRAGVRGQLTMACTDLLRTPILPLLSCCYESCPPHFPASWYWRSLLHCALVAWG